MKDKPQSVSIIIPVYNEKDTLKEIVSRVDKAPVLGLKKEIILIDDASKDGSREIAKQYEKKHRVLYHQKNQGKGASVRDGFKESSGDIIIIQDADLEYDPSEYELLLRPIVEGKADVVYGSRFKGVGPHRVNYYWHYVGNKFLTMLTNMFSNLNLTDVETCYKVFLRSAIQGLTFTTDRFGLDTELTIKLAKAERVFYEVGITYYGRSYAEGKKITWKDGVAHIWFIIKFGLSKG